jgi:tetratricopeptide (TPR) repeat protein
MRQGQRVAAIDAFGRACELMPESFEAHYNGARLLLEDKATVQQARGMLEVAYRRSPPGEVRATLSDALTQFVGSDADAMMALSQLEQARGDWGGSLRWTERVLSLPDLWANHPDRLESISLVRQVRGSLFEKLKRPAEAIQEYELSLESNPANFWTLHNLGLLLGQEGRPDLAQPYLADALKNIDALGPGTDISSIRPAVQRTLEIALQEIAAHLESFEGPMTALPELPPKKN